MKYSIFLLLVAYAMQVSAQELVFSSGKNNTRYNYKDAFGEKNESIQGDTGNFYEIAYTAPFDKNGKWSYAFALVVNEHNAKGGNLTNLYTWETKYLGIQSTLSYPLISLESGFKTVLAFGVQASAIINGEQRINGLIFDLTKEEEFKGIFLQPTAGIDFRYPLSDKLFMGLGYNYSKSTKLTNKTEEVLNFDSHQVRLSFRITLIKNKLNRPKIKDIQHKDNVIEKTE